MSRGELTAADFDAFFEALYPKKSEDDKQKTPFPWQQRLAKQVCETGAWPASLDLPTGTGKTTVLDIAVFAMAVDAARPSGQRKMPRRAILVVDRRTVVDQAELRARMIAKKLAEAQPGTILGRVAQALHGLRGDVTWTRRRNARPLEVAYLRGAIPRDDGWARDPSQPMLGVSTVDQVGSRLLFRGYGVSPGMRSVHAGLLGNDIVYFLDEVHLSRPFAETLKAVEDWRKRAKVTLPPTLQVVTMSATHHGDDDSAAFKLDDDDRRDPTLYRRLGAKKPATLEIVKVAGDEDRRRGAFAQRLADLALEATTERRRRVAVVVNRVNTALAVHDLIASGLSKRALTTPPTAASVVLVTGRMRLLDRKDREDDLRSVQAGEPRAEGDPIQVVVATQCIEAGADLDFDVLITECASLDAVVQRFGRLDRLGDHGDACGVVAIRSDHVTDQDDPVYGGARAATWQWLNERTAPLDFGLNGEVRTGAPALVFPDLRKAPVLLPAHLDLWSQTRPAPFPDPDVALWLHGRQDGSPEVNIVWRADLTVSDDSNERIDDDTLDDLLAVSPPLRQEALAVPLWAAEAWLRGGDVEGVADVEGARHDDDARDDDPATRRWAIRWRGGEDGIEIVDGGTPPDRRQLRPGDTIIVPSTYGGIRAGTWAADSRTTVVDRGDEAQLRQRRQLVLRLDVLTAPPPDDADPQEVAWRSKLRQLADQLIEARRDETDATQEDLEPIIEAICAELKIAPATRPWLAAIGSVELRSLPIPSASGAQLTSRTHLVLKARTPGVPKFRGDDDLDVLPEVSSEDDRASRTGVEVTLVEHLAHVKEQAAAFADSHGLPAGVATDVVLAAAWHDAGKADPRFQLWLVDGDEVALAAGSSPLAKSAHDSSDWRRRSAARKRAQYPRGARHELASVAMLEKAEAVLAKADDRDLVLHLIASHHGWCRPYAPVEAAGDIVEITWEHEGVHLAASSEHGLANAGASVVDRFWNMTQKYGWWGLAWLEALVRLADHRASQTEQERKGGTP
jgi:CRISPR-associated endonuclease/helicase Cas3